MLLSVELFKIIVYYSTRSITSTTYKLILSKTIYCKPEKGKLLFNQKLLLMTDVL